MTYAGAAREPVRTARLAAGLATAVTGFLATLGSLGAAFGIMTACTTDYNCTTDGCPPCAAASSWLTGGWVLQGAFFLAAVVCWAWGVRRWRPRTVRTAAAWTAAVSVAAFGLTIWAADRSYCQDGGAAYRPNYCHIH